MSTTYHLGQSVGGALANWNPKLWRGCVKDKAGKTLTPAQVKKEFEKYRDQGIEVIPMGDCDGFDFKAGCPGHPIAEE